MTMNRGHPEPRPPAGGPHRRWVLRTQPYNRPADSTIGDAASEFARRDIENLVIGIHDDSVRLLSHRAPTQALPVDHRSASGGLTTILNNL